MPVLISNKALADWLDQQLKQVYLPAFIDKIEKQQAGHEQAALTKGDTEYEKGQADALRWVLELPYIIIKSTGADTETDK